MSKWSIGTFNAEKEEMGKWKDAAKKRGITFSEFVKRAIRAFLRKH